MITANNKNAKMVGDTYEIGMSLTQIFSRIYSEYGIEQGQRIIDEALNLALKS